MTAAHDFRDSILSEAKEVYMHGMGFYVVFADGSEMDIGEEMFEFLRTHDVKVTDDDE